MAIKRAALVGVFSVLLVVGFAPAVSAGEIKGPPGPGGAEGDPTPVAGFWTGDGAASICSFSGLNDLIEEEEPTSTQSYGTFLVLVKQAFGLSTHDAKALLGESPGQECNPTRAPWGNPKQ